MTRRRPSAPKRRQPREQNLLALPDVHSPEFIAEAHRQSLAIARSPQERRDQEFIDAISDREE
ncbi:MAG TPA: antitoxin MazE-like protein [Stellaceae bacterium]|nr:antitoxin MazE-like protein [Stellaceae bacterium]